MLPLVPNEEKNEECDRRVVGPDFELGEAVPNDESDSWPLRQQADLLLQHDNQVSYTEEESFHLARKLLRRRHIMKERALKKRTRDENQSIKKRRICKETSCNCAEHNFSFFLRLAS